MDKETYGSADALNILITAGGTSEKIDDVRHIANSGTGRLGAQIAEAFAASNRDCRILYICSANAVRPRIAEDCAAPAARNLARNPAEFSSSRPALEVRVADDVRAVTDAVRAACAETAFDIIVHSMAIGDYSVRAVSDATLMAQEVTARLSESARVGAPLSSDVVADALLSPPSIRAAKISSDKENLIVVLEKAPKIIALYRGLAPTAVIVGFKLLADATEDELLAAGRGLLAKNGCDFVLANDMRTVRTNRHEGVLIAKDGRCERASGKAEIAALIVRRTLEKMARE